MTCGERRMAPPFFRRGMRTAKYAAELSSSPFPPSLSAAWSALRLHCIVVRRARWFCVCDLMIFKESTDIVLLMYQEFQIHVPVFRFLSPEKKTALVSLLFAPKGVSVQRERAAFSTCVF